MEAKEIHYPLKPNAALSAVTLSVPVVAVSLSVIPVSASFVTITSGSVVTVTVAVAIPGRLTVLQYQ